MARFDVYAGAAEGSLLLDVQSDLLDRLGTRVVIPLLPVAATPPPIRKLNPVFEIGGRKLVMATHLIATVPAADLDESRLNLARHEAEISGALDMLFQGF